MTGPDPRGALQFIDLLRLYPTVLANHQDDATVDTSSWSRAYNSLEKLLYGQAGDSGESRAAADRIRNVLVRNDAEAYNAWIMATFAPWTSVTTREHKDSKAKPHPPRAAEVARDSLRSDNKTVTILKDASNCFEDIIEVKSSFLKNAIGGTAAEVRQKIGLHIRSWKKDWRSCMILAVLQEIMRGEDFLQGDFP